MINLIKNKIYPFTLFLIAFLSHLVWFNPTTIVAFSDWNFWPNEPTKELWNSWGTWINFSNFGDVNIQIPFLFFDSLWSLITNFGFSYDIATKITFLIPIALLGFYCPYIYIKNLLGDKQIAFLGALFYGTTTYFLIGQTGHLPIVFVYAIAPLLLYLFDKCVQEENYIHSLNFLFVYVVSVYYEIRIMFIMTLILVPYYFVFHFNKSNFKKLIPVGVIIVLLNLFWLFPLLLGHLSSSVTSVANRGLFGNQLFTLNQAFAVSYSPWTGGYPDQNFVNQPVLFYLWVLPILAFSALLVRFKNYRKEVVFFSCLALIGIFLSKQSDQPFPNSYLWLYNHFPGFSLFREASKFYMVQCIGYLVLISIVLMCFKEKLKERLFNVLFAGLTILFCINLIPLSTGSIGTLFVSRTVPNDYLVFNKFILNQNSSFKLLWTPREVFWGIFTTKYQKNSTVDLIQSKWSAFVPNQGRQEIKNQIVNIFKQPFSNELLNISTIKYVIIPTQDIANDYDIFRFYGGETNPNIRQWYIDQLDKVSWLHKVDIGTKDLVVYENPTYKQPIHAFTQLFALDSSQNIDNKINFFSTALGGDFYFATKDLSDTKTNFQSAVSISQPFGNIKTSSLEPSHNVIATSAPSTLATSLYTDPQTQDIFAKFDGNKVTLFRDNKSSLALNNVTFASTSAKNILSLPAKPTLDYYIKAHGFMYHLVKGQIVKVGEVSPSDIVQLYTTSSSVVANGSFEKGLWSQAVGDCNNSDTNGLIDMKLIRADASDGKNSLQLEATRHVACTSTQVKLLAGDYLLSFDYKGMNALNAGYYLGVHDAANTTIHDTVPIMGAGWETFQRPFSIATSSSADLFVYSYGPGGDTSAVTQYDNIRLERLHLVRDISIALPPMPKNTVATSTNATWDYTNPTYDFKNLISNPSLEDGLWSEQVGDCNNYDTNGSIAMRLSKSASEGQQSLELEATRHNACTGISARVTGAAKYLLSFDYQTAPQTHEASYYVGFNSTSTDAIHESLPTKNNSWQHFERTVQIPGSATALSLSVYANESDGQTKNSVRYDNFKLIEVPDVANEYYLVSDPHLTMVEPKSIAFDLLSPTKKLVHIKGATTPFYLAFSESFHPQWKLEMNNTKVHGTLASWWPFAKPDSVSDEYHYNLDTFLNAWYVDTTNLCAVQKVSGCTQNQDGSYDIEMVIEFWPQRWFYLGLIISGTTLVACLSYLGYVGIVALRRRGVRVEVGEIVE